MTGLMVSMLTFVSGIRARLSDEEKGATAVEYGIMVALIAVVIIASVAAFGTNLRGVFTNISAELTKGR